MSMRRERPSQRTTWGMQSPAMNTIPTVSRRRCRFLMYTEIPSTARTGIIPLPQKSMPSALSLSEITRMWTETMWSVPTGMPARPSSITGNGTRSRTIMMPRATWSMPRMPRIKRSISPRIRAGRKTAMNTGMPKAISWSARKGMRIHTSISMATRTSGRPTMILRAIWPSTQRSSMPFLSGRWRGEGMSRMRGMTNP